MTQSTHGICVVAGNHLEKAQAIAVLLMNTSQPIDGDHAHSIGLLISDELYGAKECVGEIEKREPRTE